LTKAAAIPFKWAAGESTRRWMMHRIVASVLIALIAMAGSAQAQMGCAAAISGFRAVIDGDAKAGQLDRSVHDRMGPDLEHMTQLCRAGHDGEAMRALAGLKSRFGYH
jgi:hypothetical protein